MKFWYTINVRIPFQANGMFHKATCSHNKSYTSQDGPLYMYIHVLWGHRLQFPKNIVFLSLKIDFVLSKSVDPDEMPHFLMQDTVIYENLKRHLMLMAGGRS